MGKETITDIRLYGIGAKDFLAYKKINDATPNDDGSFTVGTFRDEQRQTDSAFGSVHIDYGFVDMSSNREVIIFSDKLRRTGTKEVRKVSVRKDNGLGMQQITKNVNLVVRTTMTGAVFEQKRR